MNDPRNLDADRLREFYDRDYHRDPAPTGRVVADDDFLYGQVLAELARASEGAKDVLDLGCNDGALSLWLAKRGLNVTGIDLSTKMVEGANRSAASLGLANATFLSIDFMRDWHDDAAFDLVVLSHVLEHVPDDRAFLDRIHRVLRPGGKLLLLVPTAYSSRYLAAKALTGDYAFDREVGHLRRYTRGWVTTLVDDAGFRIERTTYLDSPLRDWLILTPALTRLQRFFRPKLVRGAFNRLDAAVAGKFFPATVCVHATKP